MGLTSQVLSIPNHLISFFRQFMSQPLPDEVQGLFIPHRQYELGTHAWKDTLDHSANSCRLVRMEFCKTKNGKLHEFLTLHFAHPTHPSARAAVVIDRAAKDPSRSQSSAIVSPSLLPQLSTQAQDTVHVVGQTANLADYLSDKYRDYQTLCVLEYLLDPSGPRPPSAMQLAVLLIVVTAHQPDYSLYGNNCYWFADVVFEACKSLFPGHREVCYKHNERGRCRLNLSVHNTQSLPNICGAYHVKWEMLSQMNRVDQGAVNQQELEQKLEEARRGREEERRGREEERRGREEERRGREEDRRAYEEGRRATDSQIKQLQAELQAVRQTQMSMSTK